MRKMDKSTLEQAKLQCARGQKRGLHVVNKDSMNSGE